MPEPRFVFVLVRPGAEVLAKVELGRTYPSLRPSFSRPGLLTLKDPSGEVTEAFGADLVFARAAGLSLGLAATVPAIVERAPPEPFVLSVTGREGAPPDGLEVSLRTALGDRARSGPAAVGDLVLTVIAHEGEGAVVGLHRQSRGRWPAPPSILELPDRPAAPSRAHKKLDEALVWSGLTPRAGEVVLELGAAPGGMTLVMLERGLRVVAVDPAEMSREVLAFVGPGGVRAQHLRVPAGAVRADTLPPIDWLVVDLNLAPPVALRYVARIVQQRRPKRGAIVTLKLNDAAMVATVPDHLARLGAMGLRDVMATQLPSNRTEITAVARA